MPKKPRTKNLASADAVSKFLTEAIASGDAARITEAIATTAHGVDVLLKICTDSAAVIEAMAKLQRANGQHHLVNHGEQVK